MDSHLQGQSPSTHPCPPPAEQVKAACQQVDEIVSRRKDVEQLLELRGRLVGLPNGFTLMQVGRKLIREGRLCVVSFTHSQPGTQRGISTLMHACSPSPHPCHPRPRSAPRKNKLNSISSSCRMCWCVTISLAGIHAHCLLLLNMPCTRLLPKRRQLFPPRHNHGTAHRCVRSIE